MTGPSRGSGSDGCWPVYYDGPSYGDLTASSTNPQVMGIDDPTVYPPAPGSDLGYVVVKGVSFGTADIIVKDRSGDFGDSGTYGTSAPQISSTGTETEGVISNTSGFTFTIVPSITAVTINYDTDGSTLPDSMMGQLSSGTITIPATNPAGTNTSVFVPFNVADDGKMRQRVWRW
jgi:hypothetical protein